jgi:O-antigen ligase
VLVIKYYPSISRKYNDWTFEASFVGMTTNKNSLGLGLCVCGLSLLWMWLALRDTRRLVADKSSGGRYVVLLLMTVWLLGKAHSSTAVTCTFFGSALLLAMRSTAFKSRIGQLELYSAGLVIAVVIFQACGLWDFIVKEFAQLVGRDPTFHGRTKIWQALLNQPINPIFGVGYYSFWSPERMRKLSEGYNYLLNEAHNGYLETYLNTGIIGVFLLLGLLGTAANRIKKNVLAGDAFAPLGLAFLASAIFYGMSEAIFNRLSILWFVLLMSMLKSPIHSARTQTQLSAATAEPSRESLASARPFVEV